MTTLRCKRVFAIVLRQLYLMRGSLSRIFPLFAWVAIDMVLWGFISKYLNSVTASGFNFVPVFLGAVLLWDFFTRVMQGVTMAFFEDVWSRNFLNLFATPLSVSEYIAGLVLCSVWSSVVGLTIMLALATTVFGLSFFSYGLALAPFLAILFLSGIAGGIFASAAVLRFGPAAEWFVWPIPAVLAPFAGVFYPLSTLPRGMRMVSHALPPSYVFEGLRAVTLHKVVLVLPLVEGGILAIVYIGLACWSFTRIYRRALRSGLIARYSAESVS
jgi:ABC-2 type transport system permease protein